MKFESLTDILMGMYSIIRVSSFKFQVSSFKFQVSSFVMQ
ncbi:Uncharacterized protein dnm_042830 [Desulfonema magnum]|uniref:Uncharacterized protein n=1 Tax=Desulfonema magnum TaxID=45655 RepID=A0A975GNR5_9BACT|nr:Uncharacterized protein dnm_042830 [Desulfonema magnum]